MNKFFVWVSMSFCLAIAAVFIVSMNGSNVGATPKVIKPKIRISCPDGFTKISVDSGNSAQVTANRNGNSYVCVAPNGGYVDDNARDPYVKKKK
jgi:hypothetical protein